MFNNSIISNYEYMQIKMFVFDMELNDEICFCQSNINFITNKIQTKLSLCFLALIK